MRPAGNYRGHQDLHIALALRDAPNDHLCHWCKTPMDLTDRARALELPDAATIEHLVPRSQGGTDALDNLVRAHKRCNEARGNEKPRPLRYEQPGQGRGV